MFGELLEYLSIVLDGTSSGIVQGTQNTLEHLGFEYKWSRYSSNEMAELVKSQTDSDEVRRILTRLIGEEISLTNKGYWMRPAPHGFQNAKIENREGKKRAILLPVIGKQIIVLSKTVFM